MALSGVGTYIPTIREFLVHWNTLNVAVGEPVTLAGGFGLRELEALSRELESEIRLVNERDSAREQAQSKKDQLLTALRERVKQFRAALAYQLPNSQYRKKAPALPTFTASGKLQMDALCQLTSVWEELNDDQSLAGSWRGPLKLAGGYTILQAHNDIQALRSAYTVYNEALAESSKVRERRTELMKETAVRLRQYRQAAIANLTSGHPLLENLPAVAPTTGVSTAPDMTLTGEWDPTRLAAILTWSGTQDASHDRFEVRYHPGPKYKDAEEQVVGSVLKGVLSVITDYGLSVPHSTAWFKVYNILSNGEERGSNPVKLVRPD